MNQNTEFFVLAGDASIVVLIEAWNGILVVEYMPPVLAVRPNWSIPKGDPSGSFTPASTELTFWDGWRDKAANCMVVHH